MLISLSIKNYALIRDLSVDFSEGLSIITGETGAGKSIVLGGLSLVLGKRADTNLVYDKTRKCLVEARFDVSRFNLKPFFDKEDLDYDDELIVRREILPNGKSRAFINDTPANLTVLSELSERIIDIHSQHETLQLADPAYQFRIIDSMAGNESVLAEYNLKMSTLKARKREVDLLREELAQAVRDHDYNSFMYQELSEARLEKGELEELEMNLEKLSHSEEIKRALSEICQLFDRETFGLNETISVIQNHLNKIARFSKSYEALSERWESLRIEARDLASEIESENEELVHDPEELEKVEARLHLIYGLEKKHGVSGVEELLALQQGYLGKLDNAGSTSDRIDSLEEEILQLETELRGLGEVLHENRAAALPEFIKKMEDILEELEMRNTRLLIDLDKSAQFFSNGMDELRFRISSDRGATFESIRRIASGGEMSRLMLAVKCILSGYTNLPSIVFDEIDAGVSGEVSNRIADLMLRMSRTMQVITITHLPQVAAKGRNHYLVYKTEDDLSVASNIKLLGDDERLVHLAEMLGGSEVTESALAHARQLLS